jgi:uncharacterized protein YfiM (DUF2279 family)
MQPLSRAPRRGAPFVPVVLALILIVDTASAVPHTRVGLRAELAYGLSTPKETLSFPHTLQRPASSFEASMGVHDPWLSFDKVQHFTFSALFTIGGQYALVNKFSWNEKGALPVSMLTGFTIGLTKELHDWQAGPRRYFSWRDMAANGAGIAVAAGFILL